MIDGLPDRIVEVVAGRRHACELSKEGDTYCWGSRVSGTLGDGQRPNAHTALSALTQIPLY